MDDRLDDRPPYANDDGTLNAAGREFVTEWLKANRPIGLFKAVYPKSFWAAIYSGLGRELRQLANEAVVEAAIRHRPELGLFSTYVPWWIRSVVAKRRIAEDHERPLLRACRICRDGETLPPPRTRENVELDALPDDKYDPCDAADAGIRAAAAKQLVVRLLQSFERRTRFMVMRRFGLGRYPEHTFRELGAVYGVVHERARQIVERTIKQIRERATTDIDIEKWY